MPVHLIHIALYVKSYRMRWHWRWLITLSLAAHANTRSTRCSTDQHYSTWLVCWPSWSVKPRIHQWFSTAGRNGSGRFRADRSLASARNPIETDFTAWLTTYSVIMLNDLIRIKVLAHYSVMRRVFPQQKSRRTVAPKFAFMQYRHCCDDSSAAPLVACQSCLHSTPFLQIWRNM